MKRTCFPGPVGGSGEVMELEAPPRHAVARSSALSERFTTDKLDTRKVWSLLNGKRDQGIGNRATATNGIGNGKGIREIVHSQIPFPFPVLCCCPNPDSPLPIPYLENQYAAFTMKMFVGRSRKIAPMSRDGSSSNADSPPDRSCCHTKYRADPGRYSQRTTAFPRNECELKFGFVMLNVVDGPRPSVSGRDE